MKLSFILFAAGVLQILAAVRGGGTQGGTRRFHPYSRSVTEAVGSAHAAAAAAAAAVSAPQQQSEMASTAPTSASAGQSTFGSAAAPAPTSASASYSTAAMATPATTSASAAAAWTAATTSYRNNVLSTPTSASDVCDNVLSTPTSAFASHSTAAAAAESTSTLTSYSLPKSEIEALAKKAYQSASSAKAEYTKALYFFNQVQRLAAGNQIPSFADYFSNALSGAWASLSKAQSNCAVAFQVAVFYADCVKKINREEAERAAATSVPVVPSSSLARPQQAFFPAAVTRSTATTSHPQPTLPPPPPSLVPLPLPNLRGLATNSQPPLPPPPPVPEIRPNPIRSSAAPGGTATAGSANDAAAPGGTAASPATTTNANGSASHGAATVITPNNSSAAAAAPAANNAQPSASAASDPKPALNVECIKCLHKFQIPKPDGTLNCPECGCFDTDVDFGENIDWDKLTAGLIDISFDSDDEEAQALLADIKFPSIDDSNEGVDEGK